MATTSTNRSAPERSWLGQWNSNVSSYYLLVGTTGLLTVIGLIMVLSSSTVTSIAEGESPYAAFLVQAQYALMGLPVLAVAAHLPIRWYKRLAMPGLLVAIGLLVAVIFLGMIRNGQQNWILLGPFSFQPSKLAKPRSPSGSVPCWAASRPCWGVAHAILPAVPGAVVILGLVLAGGDLGTAVVMGLLVAGAFFVAGVPLSLMGLGGALAAFVVGYVFILQQDSGDRLGRIIATYGAECDTSSECYQSLHGLFGLGTGGLWGVGLGGSREKWNYLPEAHNDFIFAVIGEELGLFGTVLVLALFAVLGLAMSRVIRRHTDPFVKVATAAVGCWIVGQAFVNIGVVIGVLPVIGVPLPLVSAGGSALITTMAALGMVISFARTEPGAAKALAARGSVVRKSLAVLGGAVRRR